MSHQNRYYVTGSLLVRCLIPASRSRCAEIRGPHCYLLLAACCPLSPRARYHVVLKRPASALSSCKRGISSPPLFTHSSTNPSHLSLCSCARRINPPLATLLLGIGHLRDSHKVRPRSGRRLSVLLSQFIAFPSPSTSPSSSLPPCSCCVG